MKEATIGGFVMARKYQHIQRIEQEILELKDQGLTNQEIGERFGYTAKQIHDCITRRNRRIKKAETGKPIKRGRPNKRLEELPPSIQRLDRLSQLRYVMASKDRYIKRLEMEVELMRDFLSLTERK